MRPFGVVALFAGLLASLLLFAVPPVGAAETIGSIKTVRGSASVVRAGETIPASVGLKLQAGDILVTGSDGALGLILRDDSSLSLGPSSRIGIEKFLFTPAEGKLGLTTRIVRGTLTYLSGIIGRLAPDATTFVTPSFTIGVRGTHFAVRVEE
jgi:hypothetical protein